MSNLTEQFELSSDFYDTYCYGKALPLPRRNTFEPVEDRYEVVVVGGGPAGLFLTLLLARYGLDEKSVLCVDSKPKEVDIGHADGLHARSLEVLATLDLHHDFIRNGREPRARAQYIKHDDGRLELKTRGPVYFAPTRFAQLITMHQGRFERALTHDLAKYTKKGIQYNSSLVEAKIDGSDPEFPVVATILQNGEHRKVRTKYLVGADGAHSTVRRNFEINMEGDIVNEIWGVVDFVPDSNFPDVRRTSFIFTESEKAEVLMIQRERMSNGEYLVRIYVNMTPTDEPVNVVMVGDEMREEVRKKKADIKRDQILDRITEAFKPYSMNVKAGTQPLWWATYSTGQRLAQKFAVEDSQNHPRIFLVGDSCHTHSPRQGQGLNISIQDSYYLAWRLAYVLMGWAVAPTDLLRTYEFERRPWAHKVVTYDKRWNQGGVTRETMIRELREQVTGCGIEEQPSLIVSDKNDGVAWQDKDPASGILRTGRRLFNVSVTRCMDNLVMDIHNEFPSDGKYRIAIFAATDFPLGKSLKAISDVFSLAGKCPELVDAIAVQPSDEEFYAWEDMPTGLRPKLEMRLFWASHHVYETYGVEPAAGVVALVRPDGIVALTCALDGVAQVEGMLSKIIEISPLRRGLASNGATSSA